MKKLIRLTILFLFVFSQATTNGANDYSRKLTDLLNSSSNWVEGFRQMTGDHPFSYQSFRTDVTDCMLSRCTDGKFGIEWKTASIKGSDDQQKVNFIWMAAVDLTSDKNIFDVAVNGIPRFELITSTQKDWQIIHPEGGRLSFTTIEVDQNGDAHGYMSLSAPAGWLKEGESQRISITGRANQSNAWVIVYRAPDVLSFLQNSLKHDIILNVSMLNDGNKLVCSMKGSFALAGRKITCLAGGKKLEIELKPDGDQAGATINLPLSAVKKTFRLNDATDDIFVDNSLGTEFSTTRLLAADFLFNQCQISNKTILLSSSRHYQPDAVAGMKKMAESVLGKGEINLMNSSHQDIAWMDAPEKCVIERDTMLLTPMLKHAEINPDYRFDIEDALMIREYVQRHPDKKPLITQMLADGRISCGSSYIQPYEEMYSGEALARQSYLGAKWLKDEFNYDAKVYWNEDVPGRTLQMPQLMQKAGSKYLMISRHEKGIFRWYSPDGSYVTAYSPGHYCDSYLPLQKNFYDAANYLVKSGLPWDKYYSSKTGTPVIPFLSDWDMSPAKDHSQLISQWQDVVEFKNSKGNFQPFKLPDFKVVSAPEFFEKLISRNPVLPSVRGERPAVWLYIHGPSHQKAIQASREGDILMTQAEKFATILSLVEGSFLDYPAERLRRAWESKIFPDHGWGGKHGDITDATFAAKYEFARNEAKQVLQQSLDGLTSKIKTDPRKGIPLVVFNSMNQLRKDPVTITLNFEETEASAIQLTDESGKKLKVQLTCVSYFKDRTIQSAQVTFVPDNVPSIGYKTFYVRALSKKDPELLQKPFNNQAENDYFRLTFANGGLSSVYDKELGKELINTDKFKAGEVFTLHSYGNGAGEFSEIQKTDMEGYDKTGNYATHWEIEEDGPIYTTYKYRQQIRYALVEQRIKQYHLQKKIDFDTRLLNWEGILYREFRMAIPLAMSDGKVSYEVPYGVVEVGKDEIEGFAGERYKEPCRNIHPRGIENWISASNAGFGVTLSSSVAVADWLDPTDDPISNQMLQPILLASRKSCHPEGNEYLQTGDHSFHFSLTSHAPGWQNGAQFGRQSNEKLMAVKQLRKCENASLPETMGFFSITGENAVVSTIKKAEDSNEAVIRIYSLDGEDQNIRVTSFAKIREAAKTNLVEKTGQPIKTDGKNLNIQLGHHAIETIKFK